MTTAHPVPPIDRLLPLLLGVTKTPNGWDALCPAHDDTRPSLGISVGHDGTLLLRCRSRGCTATQITSAVGLTLADLFPRPTVTTNGKPKLGKMVQTYDYTDAEGVLLFQVCRFDPKDFRQRKPDGPGKWSWKLNGTPRVPYRLKELLAAPKDAWVFIVEGEKDADALARLGLVATTNPQGAGKWQTVDAETRRRAFADRRVCVIPDNDGAGWQHAETVANDLDKIAAEVKELVLGDLPDKGDISDWLAAGGTAERLVELAEGASPWRSDSWESDTPRNEAAGKPAGNTFGFRWEAEDSATFFAKDYRPEWLAKHLIVRSQPLVIGAPVKTLKTTLALDIGISLASATAAMGVFAVPVRRRVAIISGESGPFALQETGRRICRAKDIDPASLGDWLYWQFRLPQLAVEEQLDMLRSGLVRDKIEVVVVDPLYLSLLSGADGVKAENLFDVGPLLLRVAQVCESAGATPVLLHHTTKPTARMLEPLDLSHLAFSGTAEFARQWLLLSRREAYEPGSGIHRLWMVVGGSVGHSGLWAIEADEGKLDEDFGGRKWELIVVSASDARADAKAEKADAKAEERRHRDKADETAVLAALNQLGRNGEPVPFARVRDLSGLNKDRMNAAYERLAAVKAILDCPATVTVGNGAERPCRGIRKPPEGQP